MESEGQDERNCHEIILEYTGSVFWIHEFGESENTPTQTAQTPQKFC